MRLLKLIPAALLFFGFTHTTLADTNSEIVRQASFQMSDSYTEITDPTTRWKFESGMSKIQAALSWVREGERHTTGKTVCVEGLSPSSVVYCSEGTNSADASFAHAFRYMMEMYCDMYGNSPGCLDGTRIETVLTTQGYKDGKYPVAVRMYNYGQQISNIYGIPNFGTGKSINEVLVGTWKAMNDYFGWVPEFEETMVALNRKYTPVKFVVYGEDGDNYHHFSDPIWLGKLIASMNKYPSALKSYYVLDDITFIPGSPDENGNDDVNLNTLLSRIQKNYQNTIFAEEGKLVPVVTPKVDTTGLWGLAYAYYNTAPSFVMTSWAYWNKDNIYSAAALDHIARVILHETGHQMGLGHTGTVHSDNYFMPNVAPSGIELYKTHRAAMKQRGRFDRL